MKHLMWIARPFNRHTVLRIMRAFIDRWCRSRPVLVIPASLDQYTHGQCLAESQCGDAIARSWCWWSLTRFRGHDQSRAMQLFGLNMFDPKVTSIWFYYIFFKHLQALRYSCFILWFVWCFVCVQSAHLFFQVASHVPSGETQSEPLC